MPSRRVPTSETADTRPRVASPDGIVPLDIGYARNTEETVAEDESFAEGEDAEDDHLWASTAEGMPDDLYELLDLP